MNRNKHIIIYVDGFLLMIILILGIFYSLNIPLFQEEKDAVNGPLEELTGRRLPGIMNGSAAMAELADAQDLGSCAARRVGSTPTTRIRKQPSSVRFCGTAEEGCLFSGDPF